MEARFAGGAITSNGGAVLLRQADRMLGLTEQAARVLDDPRRKASCRHSARSMLRQRVFGLALGYEDLNDHDELRFPLKDTHLISKDTHLISSLGESR